VGHPAIENLTPFAFDLLFVSDESGRPILAPVAKATYEIRQGGVIAPAEKQMPLNLGGEFATKNPESSYKYEPETAFFKPATDVILIGHAVAPRRAASSVTVNLAVGPVAKSVRVFGDRVWQSTFGGTYISDPEPFETVPLVYERAFGGSDRTHPDPSHHTFERRNPVGAGFRSKREKIDGVRLPNLEDPRHPIREWSDTPPPAGFGFISPDWQPRAAWAGTYDDKWTKERLPLLPADFDRRFFNSASPGLVAPGYLRGGEPVLVENAASEARLSFDLPGTPPPLCSLELVGRAHRQVEMKLDTVIVNTEESLLILIWRSYLALRNGPHDVVSAQLKPE